MFILYIKKNKKYFNIFKKKKNIFRHVTEQTINPTHCWFITNHYGGVPESHSMFCPPKCTCSMAR